MRVREILTNSREPEASKRKRAPSREARAAGSAQALRLRGVLAYVALGSNLGDREAMLRAACERIDATTGLRILRASHLWETAPVGPPQPDYLNAVIEVDACLAPNAHLETLKRIESELGRIRDPSTRWGARTIDLDLLWQGGLHLSTGDLVLPHPRIAERSFVLAPLVELAPKLDLDGSSAEELLSRRPAAEREGVRRLGTLLAAASNPEG